MRFLVCRSLSRRECPSSWTCRRWTKGLVCIGKQPSRNWQCYSEHQGMGSSFHSKDWSSWQKCSPWRSWWGSKLSFQLGWKLCRRCHRDTWVSWKVLNVYQCQECTSPRMLELQRERNKWPYQLRNRLSSSFPTRSSGLLCVRRHHHHR